MVRPVLYSFRRCPYAMRARMALIVSGLDIELREVKLASKPAAMLLASPKGTVPVLVLPTGNVIDESLDIMRWALAQRDPENWLVSATETGLLDANDGSFKFHLDRYKYPHRYGSEPHVHQAAGVDLLAPLEERLGRAPYLAGDCRSFLDVALMPFVRQFAEVDRAFFDAQALPGVQRWLRHFIESDLFVAAMVRHEPWKEGDPPVSL